MEEKLPRAGKLVIHQREVEPFVARGLESGVSRGKCAQVVAGGGEKEHEPAADFLIAVRDEKFFDEIHGNAVFGNWRVGASCNLTA